MIYFRRALLIIAVGFVLGLGVVTARPGVINCHNSKMAVAKAHGSNGELVEALQKASPDLLHRLLHAYLPERYQHGVFPSDREAIDAIHENDPSVASAIVQIAKRQDDTPGNNNTTLPGSSTTPPPSSSTSSLPSTSTTPEQSTTSTPSSTEQTSTESTSSSESSSSTSESSTTDSTSSTSAPASTTAGQTTTSEQSSTSAPSTTPSSTEPPSTTTSAPESTATTDNTITSTTSTSSQAPETTITSGSKTTSAPVLHTFTRTLPNGGTTTLTSTSWVAVVPTDQAEGSKSPDLQNAASLPRGEVMLPAAIGLLVGAVLMV
ncbi:uncharacterized protein TRIVIDRAFT_185573 [Trichoderma virens Gv29-8]|uniref:Uncharacterized protein n=1 Tax=Hypocrea virens (strain Gv29-8 / FGSC 10586) TaxID=413071 RepID=G9MHG0_HYPVG|nr:uncharacterized protein TRIVIDRAFT_185573 [Trichoderma virens Gv29-8]EHK26148.1 hypothetical protein TRIVIDRAFT_185573 [Trichoderma virens Gv29-8]